jgi:uncharacterized membrane protein
MSNKNIIIGGGAFGFITGCIVGFLSCSYDMVSSLIAAFPTGVFFGIIGLIFGWVFSLFNNES